MDRQDFIEAHPLFYRNGYRRLLNFGLLLIILMLILLILTFYELKSRPAVKYFATTSDGRLVEIYPLSH